MLYKSDKPYIIIIISEVECERSERRNGIITLLAAVLAFLVSNKTNNCPKRETIH